MESKKKKQLIVTENRSLVDREDGGMEGEMGKGGQRYKLPVWDKWGAYNLLYGKYR